LLLSIIYKNVQKAMQSCKLKCCVSQFPRRSVTSPSKQTVTQFAIPSEKAKCHSGESKYQ